jgi:hypothetical protein
LKRIQVWINDAELPVTIIIGLLALTFLILAPFEFVGAVAGVVGGVMLGYKTGIGAAVAFGIAGLWVGVIYGSEVRRSIAPNWKWDFGGAFALAVFLSLAGALITFIVVNWSVK